MATMEGSSRPISDLLGGLVSDVSMLFRKEIELAKTEASESLDGAIGASRGLAVGAVLAIGAVGVFLAAVVSGLTAILVAMGMQEQLANFISAIVVAIVVGGIAWAMISRGIADLKANRLSMQRTAQSLKMDAATIRETV
jgi:hypothetical protein